MSIIEAASLTTVDWSKIDWTRIEALAGEDLCETCANDMLCGKQDASCALCTAILAARAMQNARDMYEASIRQWNRIGPPTKRGRYLITYETPLDSSPRAVREAEWTGNGWLGYHNMKVLGWQHLPPAPEN